MRIFHCQVSALPDEQIEWLIRALSLEEQSRAARFVFPKDRLLFAAAHALLRSCLSEAANVRQLEFQAASHGKPELNPPIGDPPWRFNLSHTNGLAACVLSQGHAVGIDAEEIAARPGIGEVARSVFTEEERRIIATGSGHRRLTDFYRLWTFKEALVKAMGRGLGLDLRDIAFTLEPLSLKIAASLGENARHWQVREFAVGETHRIAVAAKIPPDAALTVTMHAVTLSDLAGRAHLYRSKHG